MMSNEGDHDVTGFEMNLVHRETVVFNELLYAVQYMHSCTKEQLIKSIYRYYDLEEVTKAKKILHYMYKDEIGLYQARKTSTNRSELIAHVDDLISGLLYLDENGTEFTFAACNLKRIPTWEPNVIDFVSIAEKMVLLEGRLKSLEFVVSENKVEINKNKNIIGRVEKRVEQNEHCIISGIQHGSPNFPTRKYSEAVGNNQSKQSAPESVILPPLVQRPLVQRRNGITFIGKAVSREGVSRREKKTSWHSKYHTQCTTGQNICSG